MLRIGLTGGIGSGKTTVSDYFSSLYNIPVIDADEISHQLIAPEGAAYHDVIKLFGDKSVLASKEINRQYIRETIFSTPTLRDQLEMIIHPKVETAIIEQVQRLSGHYCLVVIPLLIEAGMQSMVDKILLVQTAAKLQVSRVAQRDKCHASHVESIIETQISLEEKRKHADDIINNNGAREALLPQIEALHHKYLALSK